MSDELDRQEVVTHDGGEFNVSTVRLPIPHGPEHEQHYETLVSGPKGGEYMERYKTVDAARNGHKAICEAIRNGQYNRAAVSWTLEVNDD